MERNRNFQQTRLDVIHRMADFCYDCTEELFGQSYAPKNDMSGLVSRKEYEEHGLTAKVLCEGCGLIEVDHRGKRIENA